MIVKLLALASVSSLLASVLCISPPALAAQVTPSTIFFDDFSQPELDRSKWNVIVTGRTVNNEQQAYVDLPQTIYMTRGPEADGAENGALIIHPRFSEGFTTREGRRFDFISGRLEGIGKVQFTYGKVSARIKMTAGPGLWPAFWTLGAGRWPDTGEMDIMENVGESSWTSVALHGPGYSGSTPFSRRRTFPAGTDITGWHVYSMNWTSDAFAFSVDDDVFYSATRAMIEARGRWPYDEPKFLILNVALGGNYPQAVNHAVTPYPGLPASTVDLIKTGGATMVVDWVRVTGN